MKGKVAIITGSSKGLGFAIAHQLLEEGATVIGWSRSETSIDHANFQSSQVDVGDEDQVKANFNKVLSEFGSVDIIVNNAGFGVYSSLEDMNSDVLRQMFDTNVFGIFYLIKAAIPSMKEAKSGHIINVSSIAGIAGIENMSVYNATKFAVKGMSESLFKELRPHGIKVTCVLPGSISTNFFDEIPEFSSNTNMMHPKDVADTIIHSLKAPASMHHVNLELRPFKSPNS
ncbi:MAG: SDR family oxidoreductase [Crocinitomicaceae bacterium]